MERLLCQALGIYISFNYHTNSRDCGDHYPHFTDGETEACLHNKPKQPVSRAPPRSHYPKLPPMGALEWGAQGRCSLLPAVHQHKAKPRGVMKSQSQWPPASNPLPARIQKLAGEGPGWRRVA